MVPGPDAADGGLPPPAARTMMVPRAPVTMAVAASLPASASTLRRDMTRLAVPVEGEVESGMSAFSRSHSAVLAAVCSAANPGRDASGAIVESSGAEVYSKDVAVGGAG